MEVVFDMKAKYVVLLVSSIKNFVITASFFMSLSSFMYIKKLSVADGLGGGVPSLASIVMLSLMVASLTFCVTAIRIKFSNAL